MNSTTPSSSGAGPASGQGDASMLFAQMVMQNSSMALMFMGKSAHPETGKTVRDLEASRLFIDLLEMVQVKTRGNLTADEETLLKQTLLSLRMAFVEAVNSEPSSQKPETPPAAASPAEPAPSPSEEETRKKFSKKY